MENRLRSQNLHDPVMVREVVEALKLKKFAHLKVHPLIIDATLGLGGHSEKIIQEGGFVLGIETDCDSLRIAEERLRKVSRSLPELSLNDSDDELVRSSATKYPSASSFAHSSSRLAARHSRTNKIYPLFARLRFVAIHGNFKDLDSILEKYGFREVYGILFDLGVSSHQLASESRGFSFKNTKDELDMRMDKKTQKIRASDLLNSLDQKKLFQLFKIVLPEGKARNLARMVAEKRKVKKFKVVSDFLELFASKKGEKLHPVTLSMLALRIVVNSELENLKEALPKALKVLRKGGCLIVISFHSGEDRIVKEFFKESGGKIITRKPILASTEEMFRNPRSRSAKMRVLEKI